MDTDDLAETGRNAQGARLGLGWSKEEAARKMGVSSITLKRVEDGQPVREDSFFKVLRPLGLAGLDPKMVSALREADTATLEKVRELLNLSTGAAAAAEQAAEAAYQSPATISGVDGAADQRGTGQPA